MKVLGINHIGLAAKDPDKARWFLGEVLGLECFGEELVAEQKTNTVMFDSATDEPRTQSRLEILVNHGGEDGPIATFIAKRGGGIHHLAVTVADIDAALEHMAAHQVEMIDQTPRRGAHHTRIAFVHPRSTGGLLIELVEQSHA